MKHYTRKSDACLGVILLLAGLICALMLAGTCEDIAYGNPRMLDLKSRVIPFVLMLCAILLARWQMFRSGIKWWTYSLLLATVVYSFFNAFRWFRDPMHDIAMEYFNSHG